MSKAARLLQALEGRFSFNPKDVHPDAFYDLTKGQKVGSGVWIGVPIITKKGKAIAQDAHRKGPTEVITAKFADGSICLIDAKTGAELDKKKYAV